MQIYVEQEFTSPEHIPWPGNPDNSTKTFTIWLESTYMNTTTFLRD